MADVSLDYFLATVKWRHSAQVSAFRALTTAGVQDVGRSKSPVTRFYVVFDRLPPGPRPAPRDGAVAARAAVARACRQAGRLRRRRCAHHRSWRGHQGAAHSCLHMTKVCPLFYPVTWWCLARILTDAVIYRAANGHGLVPHPRHEVRQPPPRKAAAAGPGSPAARGTASTRSLELSAHTQMAVA